MHKWSFNSLIIQVLNPSCVTSFMNGPSPTIILLKIQLPVFCNFMQNFTPVNLLSSYNWLMVVSIPHRLNDSSLKSDVGIRLLDYSGAQIVKSCVFARCSVFKPWSEYQFKKWTFQMDTIWPYFWTPINLESEYRTSESREIRSELCLNNHDTFGWVRIYSQIKKTSIRVEAINNFAAFWDTNYRLPYNQCTFENKILANCLFFFSIFREYPSNYVTIPTV